MVPLENLYGPSYLPLLYFWHN